MNIEEVRNYCLAKPGVTEDTAFGPSTILFRLCHKIFACLDLNRPDLVVVKMEADQALVLRERYLGCTGAWHWNKKYWSDVRLDLDIEKDVVEEMLDHSYELIRASLPKKTLFNFQDLPKGWHHLHFSVLDSAMNALRSRNFEHIQSDFLLISADFQTAGRGQGSNTWESEDKKNLLFAFRFYPTTIKAVDQFCLLQCISVAVAMALEKYCGNGVRIKWPNDIYVHDKKICGILIEHDLCGAHLMETRCGIGVNVNQSVFVSNAPNPVSLAQILGKEVDRAAVLRNFLKTFMQRYELLLQGGEDQILSDYTQRLYRRKGWYPYRDQKGTFVAHLSAVKPNGRLVLVDRNHIKREYAHKEVEYILSKKEYAPSAQELEEAKSFEWDE